MKGQGKKRVSRKLTVVRAPPESESAKQIEALEGVLDTQPDSLGDTYDLLRLLGAVVGQITLLDVATGALDPKARTTAARSLTRLGEDPTLIAERLRSSQFAGLNTEKLKEIVDAVRQGTDPKVALERVLRKA